MEIAIVGLGKMGSALAQKAIENGIKVIGVNLGGVSSELKELGVVEASDLEDLAKKMKGCRKIFLYVPAGQAVEEYVNTACEVLSPGDLLIDGGNSYWGDSLRRAKKLEEKEIHFIDLGTSGGVSGARNGACFMAGGSKESYELIEPLLEKIAGEDAFAHIDPVGAGI